MIYELFQQCRNFTNDNSISGNNTDDLLEILKEKSEFSVKWSRENKMIVNPDKF